MLLDFAHGKCSWGLPESSRPEQACCAGLQPALRRWAAQSLHYRQRAGTPGLPECAPPDSRALHRFLLKSTSFLTLDPFRAAVRRLRALQMDLGESFDTRLDVQDRCCPCVQLCPACGPAVMRQWSHRRVHILPTCSARRGMHAGSHAIRLITCILPLRGLGLPITGLCSHACKRCRSLSGQVDRLISCYTRSHIIRCYG